MASCCKFAVGLHQGACCQASGGASLQQAASLLLLALRPGSIVVQCDGSQQSQLAKGFWCISASCPACRELTKILIQIDEGLLPGLARRSLPAVALDYYGLDVGGTPPAIAMCHASYLHIEAYPLLSPAALADDPQGRDMDQCMSTAVPASQMRLQ